MALCVPQPGCSPPRSTVRFNAADSSREAARHSSEKLGVPCFDSLEEAAASCEAASVVTPTNTHYEIARMLLERGKVVPFRVIVHVEQGPAAFG